MFLLQHAFIGRIPVVPTQHVRPLLGRSLSALPRDHAVSTVAVIHLALHLLVLAVVLVLFLALLLSTLLLPRLRAGRTPTLTLTLAAALTADWPLNAGENGSLPPGDAAPWWRSNVRVAAPMGCGEPEGTVRAFLLSQRDR